MTVPTHRHFFLSPDLWIPLLLLLCSLPLFWLTDLDLSAQRSFFRAGEWFRADAPVFSFVYHWGNIPALILAVGSLIGFVLSFSRARLMAFRKIFIYLVLVLVMGPGLLVNSLLKDQWGRPRPRDVVEFGGDYKYERPLQVDTTSPGKSFPCGHATMGFYFIALAMVLRKNKGRLASWVMSFALLYGSLIGLARMTQGGHFLSDVIWAGALIWLVSFLLFRALSLHRQLYFQPKAEPRKLKTWQKGLLFGLILVVIFAVLLATPYKRKHNPRLSELISGRTNYAFFMKGKELDLQLRFAEYSSLTAQSTGFGAPGSKLSYSPSLDTNGALPVLIVKQRQKGIFTELSSDAEIVLDSLACRKLGIEALILKAELDLFRIGFRPQIRIEAQDLDLELKLPKAYNEMIFISPELKLETTRKDLLISRKDLVSPGIFIRAQSGRISLP